jgi:hypothetical protein
VQEREVAFQPIPLTMFVTPFMCVAELTVVLLYPEPWQMAHDKLSVLTWNVCWPVVGGIPWQVLHTVGGTVVATVVAGTVVATVVAAVVAAVVAVVVAVVVGCTVVVGALGSGFGSPTFQLRLETGKLTNPAVVTVKLPRSVYVVPVTV